LIEIHKIYLPNEKLLCEYQLWTKNWEGRSDDLNELKAIKTLEKCDKQFYSLIYTILKILATLPVSTASAERSFSTLKRLKTYLGNTIGQERLTGLVLLNIYRQGPPYGGAQRRDMYPPWKMSKSWKIVYYDKNIFI
jgi:hypothetical protein